MTNSARTRARRCELLCIALPVLSLQPECIMHQIGAQPRLLYLKPKRKWLVVLGEAPMRDCAREYTGRYYRCSSGMGTTEGKIGGTYMSQAEQERSQEQREASEAEIEQVQQFGACSFWPACSLRSLPGARWLR